LREGRLDFEFGLVDQVIGAITAPSSHQQAAPLRFSADFGLLDLSQEQVHRDVSSVRRLETAGPGAGFIREWKIEGVGGCRVGRKNRAKAYMAELARALRCF
jgi:hypothetical protein